MINLRHRWKFAFRYICVGIATLAFLSLESTPAQVASQASSDLYDSCKDSPALSVNDASARAWALQVLGSTLANPVEVHGTLSFEQDAVSHPIATGLTVGFTPQGTRFSVDHKPCNDSYAASLYLPGQVSNLIQASTSGVTVTRFGASGARIRIGDPVVTTRTPWMFVLIADPATGQTSQMVTCQRIGSRYGRDVVTRMSFDGLSSSSPVPTSIHLKRSGAVPAVLEIHP